MRQGSIVDWLEDFELFYRGTGLLGSGFRLTQDERERISSCDAKRLLQTRWLLEHVEGSNEMELLSDIFGSNVLSWPSKNIVYPELVAALTTISRGSFAPADLSWGYHEAGDRSFSAVRCSCGGSQRAVYLPYSKWLHEAVFVEVNRWIAHTGRRFVTVGWNRFDDPIFACIDDGESAAIRARGIETREMLEWDVEPRELIPLAVHFVSQRDFEHALEVTSFNPSLGGRAPELHLYRALSRVGLGQDTAWEDVAAAQAAGIKDAARRVEALRTELQS